MDKEKFDKTLDKLYEENHLEKPLKLYLKAKQKLINEIDTANVPLPKSKESFIRRRQIKKVPKLPKTISDFIESMASDQFKHYSLDERKSAFYRGIWEVNGDANIVFISQSALELVNSMDNIRMFSDGTFKVLPRHFRRRFRQLYVINVMFNCRCYPLAYILMQRKNFESYDLILSRLKLLFPSVTVISCMSDYEPATRKALVKHFPMARICGCFFHYVQAMHVALKKHGMLKDEQLLLKDEQLRTKCPTRSIGSGALTKQLHKNRI